MKENSKALTMRFRLYYQKLGDFKTVLQAVSSRFVARVIEKRDLQS
jgi:hypothetical protein